MDNFMRFQEAHPNATVYVTGFSLGGVEATYTAIDLNKDGIRANLMTFGSPRPGNVKFAKFANSQLKGLNYRITYKNDKIPVLPDLSSGYHHVGTEVKNTLTKM